MSIQRITLSVIQQIDIYDLPPLQCSDRNCQGRKHKLEIDQVCNLLADMCISTADPALPKVAKRNAITGWNVDILPLKRTAEFWGKIWRENGRPSTGIVSDIFRKCRREYHYAIRAKTSHDDSLRRERLAESVAVNNSRDTSREIRKIAVSHKTSPLHIDVVTDRGDIEHHFGNENNPVYNSIPVVKSCHKWTCFLEEHVKSLNWKHDYTWSLRSRTLVVYTVIFAEK